MQVYVSKDGKQYGPYAVEQLRQYVQQGNFTTGDHACHDGQNWVTIAQVPGFAEATQPAATPPPTTPQQDQAVREHAVEQQPASANASNSPAKKKKIILWSSIGGIATLLVTGLLIWILGGDEGVPESNQSPAEPPDAKPAQVSKIDLDDPETFKKIVAKAVKTSQLHRRGKKGEELVYAPNQQTPYTGWAKEMYDNGQISYLNQYIDGKADGLQAEWYENGQKRRERTDKDGELMTIVDWKPSGEKLPEPKLVIITRTGNGKNANSDGSSPHAHIIGLDGSRSSLGPLNNIEVDDREAGSTDIFSLPFDYPVSEIRGVELEAKANDAWRVETISFQFFADGKKSKPYAFEVNQWFSAEKKDFREIGALKSKVFTFRPESNANHSPASPPPDAKIAQVGKIDLDDPETFKKIVAKAVNLTQLQSRGKKGEELLYRKNQPKPYTGWSKWMHGNGQIKFLTQRKDGKRDGLQMWWYENGRKRGESTFKDGKKDGLQTWWYENLKKRGESTWKDGRIMTSVVWKPNGEKCLVTNVVNGNGVKVSYNNDGAEKERNTYREGELVSD
jgi:antitoxin component YwqK of YwqJK toxin-antitoxin module